MQEIRKLLREDQWKTLEPLLPGKAGDRGAAAQDNRLFIEAVFTMAGLTCGTGKLAHDIHAVQALGPTGVWARVVAAVNGDRDLEALRIDEQDSRSR